MDEVPLYRKNPPPKPAPPPGFTGHRVQGVGLIVRLQGQAHPSYERGIPVAQVIPGVGARHYYRKLYFRKGVSI